MKTTTVPISLRIPHEMAELLDQRRGVKTRSAFARELFATALSPTSAPDQQHVLDRVTQILEERLTVLDARRRSDSDEILSQISRLLDREDFATAVAAILTKVGKPVSREAAEAFVRREILCEDN